MNAASEAMAILCAGGAIVSDVKCAGRSVQISIKESKSMERSIVFAALSINLLLVKKKPKRQLRLHYEIDGEENSCQKI